MEDLTYDKIVRLLVSKIDFLVGAASDACTMFTPDHPSLEYAHPYRHRTFWRIALPRPFCWWVDKGEDCESVAAEHHWYNQDGEHSACYHCKVVRPGQLWGE